MALNTAFNLTILIVGAGAGAGTASIFSLDNRTAGVLKFNTFKTATI
jgi:hypothetical protein